MGKDNVHGFIVVSAHGFLKGAASSDLGTD